MARTATPNRRTSHYIVDGSNIATEGRAMPSLTQLNEAVLAFMDEHPDALITVVVDATFGHRIDKKEVKAFDDAVANNELVTPPAGAVGRGDAFVLSIANKAKAGILSNDSFQEFHGQYEWLFEDGRLIGGKPVPHVGWVFVERLPVRGPKSRQSVKDAKQAAKPRAGRGSGSPLADQPLPVPTSPPPGPAATPKSKRAAAEVAVVAVNAASAAGAAAGPRPAVNELLPFLDFVERHPVGTGCTVVVESYASHGAYARAGDVLVYLPLRLMGDPVPRSARAAVKIGEAVAVVIVGYVPERRSVDAALVSAGAVPAPVPAPAEPTPVKRRSRKQMAAEPEAVVVAAAAPDAVADEQPTPVKRRSRKRAAAEPEVASEVAAVVPDAVADAQPAPTKRRSRSKQAAAPEPEVAPKPRSRAKSSAAKQPTPEPDVPVEAKPVTKRAAKSTAKSPAKPATKSQAKPPAQSPAPAKRTRAAKAEKGTAP